MTVGGRTRYLGPYGSPESHRAYARALAELAAGGGRSVEHGDGAMTVVELAVAYLEWAEAYYRKNGRATDEVVNVRTVLRVLLSLYADLPVAEFSAIPLKACRQMMIDRGWVRGSINKQIGRLRAVFRWGVEEELVPVGVLQSLRAVAGLRRGRCPGVRESEPVVAVDRADVDAVCGHVSREVWAMVQLQWISGMRSGEVVTLRPCDLVTDAPVWVYRPATHKTEHHGRRRAVALGPLAQCILERWLWRGPPGDVPLFSPAAARARQVADMRRRRRSRVQPSQVDRGKPRPRRVPGAAYSTDSYRRAIARACEMAGVPRWHPHQLRHACKLRVEAACGLEVARAVLGHASVSTTELSGRRDLDAAVRAAAAVG